MIYAGGFEMAREVANHGSFTKAADALGVSAAAVSKQIKALEQRLGLVLFHSSIVAPCILSSIVYLDIS